MGKSKFKVQKMITYLCVIVSILTIVVGVQGLRLAKASNENTKYMYGYYNWSKMIEEINTNITNMQLNRIKAEHGYENTYQENINVYNVNVMKNYNEYMSTENESEEEKKYLDNIGTFYGEYYKLTTEALETIKNGGQLSPETKDKLSSLENNLQVNITGIRKYLANWAETDKSDMDKMYVRTKFLYIVIIAVCMIVSIGSGIFVANISSRHVRDLKRAYRKNKKQKDKKELVGNDELIREEKLKKLSETRGIDAVKHIQQMKEIKAEQEKEQAAELARQKALKEKMKMEEMQARREMKEAEEKAKQKELELRREVEAYKARREAEEAKAREEARARKEAEEAKAREEARARKEAEEAKAREEARARKEAEEAKAREEAKAKKARKKADEKQRKKKKIEITNEFDGLDDFDDLETIKELMGLEGISNTRELEMLEELGELE